MLSKAVVSRIIVAGEFNVAQRFSPRGHCKPPVRE
jgi:hypothetical protein